MVLFIWNFTIVATNVQLSLCPPKAVAGCNCTPSLPDFFSYTPNRSVCYRWCYLFP